MRKICYASSMGQVFWLALHTMRRFYLMEAYHVQTLSEQGAPFVDSAGYDRSEYIPNILSSFLQRADAANAIIKLHRNADHRSVLDQEFAFRHRSLLLEAMQIFVDSEYRSNASQDATWSACDIIRRLTGGELYSKSLF